MKKFLRYLAAVLLTPFALLLDMGLDADCTDKSRASGFRYVYTPTVCFTDSLWKWAKRKP